MSDYLWDKTGEADADVARLEELLGGLRYEPRALELPPESSVASSAPRRSWPPRPALLAAAAALLLALLAGALVLLRQGVAQDKGQASAQPPAPHKAAPPSPPEKRERDDERAGREDERRGEKEQNQTGVGGHKQPARAPRGARVEARRVTAASAAGVKERSVKRAHGSRELAAKEQLMYALRLTSAKLEEVRKKVRGEGETEEVPAERNGTR